MNDEAWLMALAGLWLIGTGTLLIIITGIFKKRK